MACEITQEQRVQLVSECLAFIQGQIIKGMPVCRVLNSMRLAAAATEGALRELGSCERFQEAVKTQALCATVTNLRPEPTAPDAGKEPSV